MPHVGSYFLYAALSVPSQTLTAAQAGSPGKLKGTLTEDGAGSRQAGRLALRPSPPSLRPPCFLGLTTSLPVPLVVQPELLLQQLPFRPRKQLCQVRKRRCIGKCSFLKTKQNKKIFIL